MLVGSTISDGNGRDFKLVESTVADLDPESGFIQRLIVSNAAIGDYVNIPIRNINGSLGNLCFRRVR